MNYFAKKNYARGQQKKRVEHIFDTLTDGFSKAQFEDLRSFQSVYNERFESLKMSFEEFVKVDEKVVNRSVELAIDAHLIEIENQLEEVNKKLASLKKYENATFLQKFDDDYKLYSNNQGFAQELRQKISEYHALEYTELCFKWKKSLVPKLFIDKAFRELKKTELRRFEKKFESLGIKFTPDREPNFDRFSKQYLLNPQTYIFHYRPTFVPEPLSNKVPEYKFKFNYFEKWQILRTEKKLCSELINKRLTKISRKEKERNLRALASEKKDRQRVVATSQRSQHNFNDQISLIKTCPYCFGDLGSFKGRGAAQLDHIHPVAKGGLSTTQNLVYICSACNREKSDKTLNAFIRLNNMDRDRVFEALEILGKDF